MRAVLDTNVVVSAFLSPTGAPARVLVEWESQRFEAVVSEPLLGEYRRALLYDRVAAHHGMATEEVLQIIAGFREFGLLVAPRETIAAIAEDPDDNRVLECAVAGSADYIVSGDRHLLRLGEYRGIPILSPAAFLSILPHGVDPHQ